jgi:hypothetical protein
MNKRIYRTAGGKQIDMDALRVANEDYIAVGNMKTNARGDELGPGGKVIKTREEILADRKKEMDAQAKAQPNPTVPQNSPRKVTADTPVQSAVEKAKAQAPVQVDFPDDVDEQDPLSEEELAALKQADKENTKKQNQNMRGSLAASVAGEKTVTQELEKDPRKPDGPQRMK